LPRALPYTVHTTRQATTRSCSARPSPCWPATRRTTTWPCWGRAEAV